MSLPANKILILLTGLIFFGVFLLITGPEAQAQCVPDYGGCNLDSQCCTGNCILGHCGECDYWGCSYYDLVSDGVIDDYDMDICSGSFNTGRDDPCENIFDLTCIGQHYGETCPGGPGGDTETFCDVQNVSCPAQVAIGQNFNISYEFWGTGPNDFRYEVRTGLRDAVTQLWCIYDDDKPEGQWHSETQTATCPAVAGTYTFNVRCLGASSIDANNCGEYDDQEYCLVQCVAPCAPDTSKTCCENPGSVVDTTATTGAAPGMTCSGATGNSCWAPAGGFNFTPGQISGEIYNDNCCGDDTSEYFVSSSGIRQGSGLITSQNRSCDGTTACCREDDPAGYNGWVQAGQCVNGCSLTSPTNLRHIANTLSTITWQWNSVLYANYYVVSVFDDDTGAYLPGASNGNVIGTTWQSTGLATNHRYRLTVYACNAETCDGVSGPITAESSMQRPSSLSCSNQGPNSLTVTANGPFDNLTAGNSGIKFVNLMTGAVRDFIKVTSWNVGGLDPGTTYNFTGQSCNSDCQTDHGFADENGGDFSAIVAGSCTTTDPVEDCDDEADNDGDTFIDCLDPDCPPIACPLCQMSQCNPVTYQWGCVADPSQNGDPCDDGQFCTVGDACLNGACQSGPARDCVPPGPRETSCTDGIDNDGDGDIDAVDSDCCETFNCNEALDVCTKTVWPCGANIGDNCCPDGCDSASDSDCPLPGTCNPDEFGNASCCDGTAGLSPTEDIDRPTTDFDRGSCGGGLNSCYGLPFSDGAQTVSYYDDLCCQDDSGEFWQVRICLFAAPNKGICLSDGLDEDCCQGDYDCVYNVQCYDPWQAVAAASLGLSEPGFCNAIGMWLDCDENSNACNACDAVVPAKTLAWVQGGEVAVFGEYDTGNATECCGDDSDENYVNSDCAGNPVSLCCSDARPFVDGGVCVASCNEICDDDIDNDGDGLIDCLDTEDCPCGLTCPNCQGCGCSGKPNYDWQCIISNPPNRYYSYFKTFYTGGDGSVCDDITDERCVNGGADPADDACCPNDDDCVYNGTCYPKVTSLDLNGNGRIDGFCMTAEAWKSHWRDYDSDEGGCNMSPATWAQGGETFQFGEYDTGSETECCGDDSNEEYISGTSPQSCDGTSACCDNAADLVEAGQCVAACTPVNNPPFQPEVVCPYDETPPPPSFSADPASCPYVETMVPIEDPAGSGNGPILKWQPQGGGIPDPDWPGELVVYVVYFENDPVNNPGLYSPVGGGGLLAVAGVNSVVYPTVLNNNQTYSWYVIAIDFVNDPVVSDVWEFTTAPPIDNPPNAVIKCQCPAGTEVNGWCCDDTPIGPCALTPPPGSNCVAFSGLGMNFNANGSSDIEDCPLPYPDATCNLAACNFDSGLPFGDLGACAGGLYQDGVTTATITLEVVDQAGQTDTASKDVKFIPDAYADFDCCYGVNLLDCGVDYCAPSCAAPDDPYCWKSCTGSGFDPKVIKQKICFRGDDGAGGLSRPSEGGTISSYAWTFNPNLGDPPGIDTATGVITPPLLINQKTTIVSLMITDTNTRQDTETKTINANFAPPDWVED